MKVMWSPVGVVFGVAGLAAACAPVAPQGGIRSPSHDYPQSEARTSDGEPVGADRQRPEDKLANGAAVSPKGFIPSGGPNQPERKSPIPAPQQVLCAEIGMETKDGRCKVAPIPPERPQ